MLQKDKKVNILNTIENDIEKEIEKYSKDYTYTQILIKILETVYELDIKRYKNPFWIDIFIIETLLNKIIEKENLEIDNSLNKNDKLILILNKFSNSDDEDVSDIDILEIIKQYYNSKDFREKVNKIIIDDLTREIIDEKT